MQHDGSESALQQLGANLKFECERLRDICPVHNAVGPLVNQAGGLISMPWLVGKLKIWTPCRRANSSCAAFCAS